MTGCSLLAHETKTNLNFKFLPFDGLYQSFARCLPSGLYDPLQCYEGACACVDPYTGVFDETVDQVALSALAANNPLCFNATLGHHIGYYQKCEQALRDLQRARDIVEAEGNIFLFPFKVDCKPDGHFSKPPTTEMIAAIQQLRAFVTNSNTKFI